MRDISVRHGVQPVHMSSPALTNTFSLFTAPWGRGTKYQLLKYYIDMQFWGMCVSTFYVTKHLINLQ